MAVLIKLIHLNMKKLFFIIVFLLTAVIVCFGQVGRAVYTPGLTSGSVTMAAGGTTVKNAYLTQVGFYFYLPHFMTFVDSGGFQFTTGAHAGYIFTSDANGNASWAAPVGTGWLLS